MGNTKKVFDKEKVNEKLCISLIIFFTVIMHVFCFTYDYLQDGDELSSIAFPVYLAGGDWSDMIAKRGRWHGYGHVLIYAPFFRFCKTWTEMYNVCRIGSLMNWIFLAVLIFYMASRQFKIENLYSLMIALVCTMGNLKPDYGIGLSVMSELPMGIISVVCMLFLFRANTEIGRKRKVYSFLLFFLLMYSLSVHSRAIALILAAVILIFLILILYRYMIVSPIFSMIGGTAGFFVYKLLNWYYRVRVLTNFEGIQGSVVNDISNVQSVGVTRLFGMFTSIEYVILVIKIFFSLLGGFLILSFGLLGLFIVVDIQYIIEYKKCFHKRADNLVIGILFGLMSFIMMNGFIAIKQYKSVLSGDYRWFIYLRYAIPYAILIVFTGLVVIIKKKCNVKKALSVATIVNACVIVFFLKCTLSEIKNTSIMNTLANIFRQYFYNGEKTNIYFYIMTMVALTIWLLSVWFLRRNKQFVVWCGYIMISTAFTISSFHWHYDKAQEVYTYTDASEKVIERLEMGEGPQQDITVYYNSEKRGNAEFPRYLRANCPWSEIYDVKDEDIAKIDLVNSIILSNNERLNETLYNIYKIELDDNEFLYTGNVDIYNWLN